MFVGIWTSLKVKSVCWLNTFRSLRSLREEGTLQKGDTGEVGMAGRWSAGTDNSRSGVGSEVAQQLHQPARCPRHNHR